MFNHYDNDIWQKIEAAYQDDVDADEPNNEAVNEQHHEDDEQNDGEF